MISSWTRIWPRESNRSWYRAWSATGVRPVSLFWVDCWGYRSPRVAASFWQRLTWFNKRRLKAARRPPRAPLSWSNSWRRWRWRSKEGDKDPARNNFPIWNAESSPLTASNFANVFPIHCAQFSLRPGRLDAPNRKLITGEILKNRPCETQSRPLLGVFIKLCGQFSQGFR